MFIISVSIDNNNNNNNNNLYCTHSCSKINYNNENIESKNLRLAEPGSQLTSALNKIK